MKLHRAVLHQIEKVLAAANCTGLSNRSLSGGSFVVKVKQLSGTSGILFFKALILKSWLKKRTGGARDI